MKRRLPCLPTALALGLLCPGAGPAWAEPAVDYMLECQGCHLADGSGSPGAVPDMRGVIGRFARLPEGRAYLVRVPGSAGSRLSDEALAEVLNWMLRRFAPEAAAGVAPYSAEEVARYRGQPLLEVDALRERLLRSVEAAGAAGAGIY